MQTLITDEQLEAMYGIKRKTLANWRVKGLGPSFVKIGAAVRYRPEDVQAWIDSRVFSSTSMYRQRMTTTDVNRR
jgi:predicted DNA-binding transcriptional regulator AlpA